MQNRAKLGRINLEVRGHFRPNLAQNQKSSKMSLAPSVILDRSPRVAAPPIRPPKALQRTLPGALPPQTPASAASRRFCTA